MKKTGRARTGDKPKGGDKSYVIKHIPPILWRGVKMRAAERGETVKTVMINLLVGYAAGDISLD
jgi:hypothetical protein